MNEQQGLIRAAIEWVNWIVSDGRQWLLPALYIETLERKDEEFAEAMLFVLEMRADEDPEFARLLALYVGKDTIFEEERIAA